MNNPSGAVRRQARPQAPAKWGEFEIVCPRCWGSLAAEPEALRCAACETAFPIDLGVPDVRVFPDPYISIENDRAKGRHLASRFQDFDFAGLVGYYYSITPAVRPDQARMFTAGVLAAGARARVMLESWHNEVGKPRDASLLEIGCGTAPLLLAAREQYARVMGLDISYRWLTVGRKRMEETGVHVPILCGCAEALPFPSGTFDRVAMESTLEVTRDQPATLRECMRVLRPGGALLLTTQNRFSPGPDPHTGLWGGSMLPPAWVLAYVRWRGGIPPRRRFLSAGSLRRSLSAAGFNQIRVLPADVTAGQSGIVPAPLRIGISAYRAARTLPLAGAVARLIAPSLLATARKPA